MQERALETRDRILQAAATSFGEKGYEAASVLEICQQANVSKGAFYHHFETKHALFMVLLEIWLSGIEAEIKRIMSTARDIPSGLIAMTALLPVVLRDADDQIRLYLEFWLSASRDSQVRAALVRPIDRFSRYFTELLERGVQEGTFSTLNPELVSRLILAVAMGVLVEGMMDRKATDWAQVASEGIKMMIKDAKKEQE